MLRNRVTLRLVAVTEFSMPSYVFRLVMIVLLAVTGSAGAAHITDKLVVGVYAEPNSDGEPLRLISSGTPLEVLGQKAEFSEVRLADETRGWVEKQYITEEKPANAMLLETQAKLRQMGLELAALRAKSGTGDDAPAVPSLPPSAREAQLQQALDEAEQYVAELQGRVQQLQVDADSQQRLASLQSTVRDAVEELAATQGLTVHDAGDAVAEGGFERYGPWLVGGFALLLGFAAGVAFIDYRIRKRYGGFRI